MDPALQNPGTKRVLHAVRGHKLMVTPTHGPVWRHKASVRVEHRETRAWRHRNSSRGICSVLWVITNVNYARARVTKILVSANFLPSSGTLRLMQANSFVIAWARWLHCPSLHCATYSSQYCTPRILSATKFNYRREIILYVHLLNIRQ